MKARPIPSLLLFATVFFSACQSGEKSPQSAEEANDIIVGKTWAVKDVGVLESSFRENKGEPFVHTINWFSASKELGSADNSARETFSKATLVLDEKTPNGESATAHLEGLNLGQKQQYYFTSTQEENGYDRTVKLYVNCVDSTGALMQYPFTILAASSKKLTLQCPRELTSSNLVLSLEAQ